MQHGQILELKTKGADGRRLWAYRYRLDGRGSPRIQRGGYAAPTTPAKLSSGRSPRRNGAKGASRITLG